MLFSLLGILLGIFPARAQADLSPQIGEAVHLPAPLHAPDYNGCGGQNAPAVNPNYEQQVLDLVNQIRADNGLPPLKLTPGLVEAARYHATDMGQDNYFTHDSQDIQGGTPVVVCSWADRINTYYTNWNSLAENIAAGYYDPASVMNGWMNSDGHRANILRDSVREIGIGYFEGSGNYYRYWVQDFGRRSNVYPLIINQDQAATDNATVTLYLYGQGTFTEMRLRNDDGTWGAWQPFQASISWDLVGPIGDHTVWAELKNGSETYSTSDTIYLSVNAAMPTLGNLPSASVFLYSLADQQLYPPNLLLAPQNTGTSDPLTWAVTPDGTWFDATPLTGSTPETILVTPTTFPTDTVGTYTGSLTITVTDPPGTLNTPQVVNLTLNVVAGPIEFVFLPVIFLP